MRALLAKRCKQRVVLAPVGAPLSLPCISWAALQAHSVAPVPFQSVAGQRLIRRCTGERDCPVKCARTCGAHFTAPTVNAAAAATHPAVIHGDI